MQIAAAFERLAGYEAPTTARSTRRLLKNAGPQQSSAGQRRFDGSTDRRSRACGEYSKDAEAIARLSSEQYRVTQQNGTEPPGTGQYLHNKAPGIYVDIVSGEPLFASSDKYESGCGWPSFTKAIEPANVSELRDSTHGMVRTEVRSAHGDSHLGHIFPDGPADRGGSALLHQFRLAAVHPSR